MLLIVGTSSKEEGGGWSSSRAIAEPQCPETVNHDPLAVGPPELALEVEVPSLPTVRIDAAIPKVAHEQVIAESTKIRRGEDQPPGRNELPVRGHALDEVAVGIEDINETMALACDVILFISVLLRISDIELAFQVLNIEGRKSGGDVRVREGTSETGWGKGLVEHVNRASMEIGGVEKVAGGIAADGQSLVDRAGGRVIHGENSSRGKERPTREKTQTRRRGDTRIPARDRAIFSGKNEEAGAGAAAAGNDEVGRGRSEKIVKDLASGGAACRRDGDYEGGR